MSATFRPMDSNKPDKTGEYVVGDLDAPLTFQEFDELSAFLLSDATPEQCLNMMKLDGFLTAIVIGPNVVMPSTWLPGVWGDVDGPEFESMEQAGRITGLIFRHMNSIAQTFLNNPLAFKPLFMVQPARSEADAAEDWCNGFLHVMASEKARWDELLKSKARVLLTPIVKLGFNSEQVGSKQVGDSSSERQGWIDLLPKSTVAIHGFWRDHRHQSFGGSERPLVNSSSSHRTKSNKSKNKNKKRKTKHKRRK